ncbi:MAG TPA: hypothetical protein VGS12_04050 [Caulobacteraceae bacterium]|nr:hypothetical protein [Caulobacteraceae bacterium]
MFHGWESFFGLTGTAAASLIGLLFIVATLRGAVRDRSQALLGASLFLTPSAMQFGVVLAVSALALAPPLPAPAAPLIVALAALAGLGHAGWASFGIASPSVPLAAPHWSDLWLYGVAPGALYLVLGGSAAALAAGLAWADAAMAAACLALLLMAIRNAWDLVTWMAPARDERPSGD